VIFILKAKQFSRFWVKFLMEKFKFRFSGFLTKTIPILYLANLKLSLSALFGFVVLILPKNNEDGFGLRLTKTI
jgi:predicted membrane-bound mannosyltransferase